MSVPARWQFPGLRCCNNPPHLCILCVQVAELRSAYLSQSKCGRKPTWHGLRTFLEVTVHQTPLSRSGLRKAAFAATLPAILAEHPHARVIHRPQTAVESINQSPTFMRNFLFFFFFVAARRGMGRRQPPRLRSRAFIWKSSIRDEAACFVNALHCSVAAKSPTLYVPTNIPELKVPRYVLSSRAEHRSSSAPRPADLPSWSDESSQGESRGRSVGRSANLRRPANRSSPTGQRPSPSNLEAGRWHAPIPSPAIPRFPVPPPTHLFFFFFFRPFLFYLFYKSSLPPFSPRSAPTLDRLHFPTARPSPACGTTTYTNYYLPVLTRQGRRKSNQLITWQSR